MFVLVTYTLDFLIFVLADHIPQLKPDVESDNFLLNALRSNL